MTRRLGRRAHDPAALAAAPPLRYATAAPPILPPELDRSTLHYQPQMFANDTLPDCSVAALLNGALAINALSDGGGLTIRDNCWLDFYAACAGCAATPEAIAGTDGLVLLDVLQRQGTTGFDIGEQAPLTGDWGKVALDRHSIARVIANLGFAYLGVDLSQAEVNDASDLWKTGDGDPALGHCLLAWDYTGLEDDDAVGLVTWGGFQEAAWSWVENRVREAYALLFRELEPTGLDVDALRVANAGWLKG